MAKLLQPSGEARRQLRKRITEIYKLRSDVVHGREAAPQEVAQASLEAITLAADALRALITDKPDLIPMTSGERSLAILMN